MKRWNWKMWLCVAWVMSMGAGSAHADRRYFVYSYTPFLRSAGGLEMETWLTSASGKTGTRAPEWQQRMELEYAPTDRVTTAGYLNFSQSGDPGAMLRFEGPSLEVIWKMVEPGRIFGDPAAYLELGDSGERYTVEPKLLLGGRHGRWVLAANLVGEMSFPHGRESGGEVEPVAAARRDRSALEGSLAEEVVERELEMEFTGGLSYELHPQVAVGLEARYQGVHPDFGAREAAMISVGPVVNVQSRRVQLALGVQPQVWGTPSERGRRNLSAFDKVQVRAILGVDL